MITSWRKECLHQAEQNVREHGGLIYLRERLRRAGLSQRNLARLGGWPSPTVNNWCACRNYPSAAQMPKLALILKCEIMDLYLDPDADPLSVGSSPRK